MDSTPTVATAQFQPVIGAVETNVSRMDRLLAKVPDADLVVFPELAVTGYDLEEAVPRASPVPGPLTDPLVDLASAHDVALVAGLPERTDDALYNALVYVDRDEVRATYRKQYPWGDERSVFDTGSGPVTVDTELGRVGFLVCYDLNFPEASLAYVRRGVDLLVVSAAWRTEFRRDWRLLLRARALDGTWYAVGSNHVGDQSGREHAGTSLVAGPDGSLLEAADDRPGVVAHEIDDEVLRAARDRNPVRDARRGR